MFVIIQFAWLYDRTFKIRIKLLLLSKVYFLENSASHVFLNDLGGAIFDSNEKENYSSYFAFITSSLKYLGF